MKLTYAKRKNPAHEGITLPAIYDVFVVLKDGVIRGEIKWAYRPKNAGGRAWCARLDNEHGTKTCYWSPNRDRLLPMIRTYFEDMQRKALYEQANPSPGGTCPVASAAWRERMLSFL